MVDTMNKAEELETLQEIDKTLNDVTLSFPESTNRAITCLRALITRIEAEPEPLADIEGWTDVVLRDFDIGQEWMIVMVNEEKRDGMPMPVRVVVYPVEPPA